MNNRHRLVSRLKKEQASSEKLKNEVAILISAKYEVSLDEAARQVEEMIAIKCFTMEYLDRRNAVIKFR